MNRLILAASFGTLVLGAITGTAGATNGPAPPPLNVGSDGSDGVFTFVPDTPGGNTMTIDLALAASGLDGGGMPITWQTPSPVPGRGVYDPVIWSVVFKYSSVTIQDGQTIRFSNHPSNAPVVWLVGGVCEVRGAITYGGSVASYAWSVPGPGGFRGGVTWQGGAGSGGFGPGGGVGDGSEPTWGYGSATCFPLIGGSGSGGGSCTSRSGAGGGALLIAADLEINILGNASISAAGGSYFCSSSGCLNVGAGGGVLRLVSDVVTKSNTSSIAMPGGICAPAGRVRIEANSYNGLLNGTPVPTLGPPGQLLPDASTASVRVVSATIGGQVFPIPADPRAETLPMSADTLISGTGSATFLLEARNVDPGRVCTLRVLNVAGSAVTYTSTPLAGSFALSTATVTFNLSTGVFAMQARVVL